MIQTILVTLDGSPLAEGVLPYVVTIARGLNARVTLLHAIDQPVVDVFREEPSDWLDVQEMRDSTEKAARQYLKEKSKRLEGLGIRSESSIGYGKAADVILDYADANNPDLIATSTHGRSGLRRMVMGSVAGRVLHGAKAPLLLARPSDEVPEPVAKLDEIIVPLDTSEHSEAVLPLVTELARGLNLRVNLVMALPKLSQLYFGTEPVVYPIDTLERAEQAAGEYLQQTARRLEADDALNVRWEVLHGDTAGAIVDYAEDLNHNLVAMSTHGRSGLGRWMLGSVTDKVARSSSGPVVVVRPAK